MAIVLLGSTSGSVTLQEPAVAGTTVLSLPASSGTFITTGSSGQSIPRAALPTGSVLQVVQTVKSDTFSTTAGAGSPATITGLSASITPTSSSNKVMVMVNFGEISGSENTTYAIFMFRNGTKINAGNAAGSRSIGTVAGGISSTTAGNWAGNSTSIMFLDSPASISLLTYTFAIGGNGIGAIIYINQDGRNSNVANDSTRTPTNIILMEIAA
jgi:hypothetical protein